MHKRLLSQKISCSAVRGICYPIIFENYFGYIKLYLEYQLIRSKLLTRLEPSTESKQSCMRGKGKPSGLTKVLYIVYAWSNGTRFLLNQYNTISPWRLTFLNYSFLKHIFKGPFSPFLHRQGNSSWALIQWLCICGDIRVFCKVVQAQIQIFFCEYVFIFHKQTCKNMFLHLCPAFDRP